MQVQEEIDRRLAELRLRYPERDLPGSAEVARVAPSPTGRPHIGTALQSTIDYALARKHEGGVFILRIEDTDRKRLVPGAMEDIVAAMRWLQVPPDEGPGFGGAYGPYLESERLEIYATIAEWLVAHDHAYPCFCTPERLAELRAAQTAAGQPPGYDRHCRYLTPEERARHIAAGEIPVIRLAMPLEGTIAFEDLARGWIEFRAEDQDDPVLLKSDGYPTYHLAAIVDDYYMDVTTVVRGEEWISSTPKHLVLYRAMGWGPPAIVHTPLLRDAQGRKLSKRTGDTSIAWFRTQGYLPEAFRNFLTRIIWPHPEGKDIYPFEDFIANMAPRDLPKTGPVADHALLDFISGEYMKRLDPPALYVTTAEWMEWILENNEGDFVFEVGEKQGRVQCPVSREELIAFRELFIADPAYTERVLSLEPERYKKLGDIVLQTRLYYPALFTPAPLELLTKPTKGDRALATQILQQYIAQHDPSLPEEAWQERAYTLAEAAGVKPGVVFMLLRVSITGGERTPPLYPIMQVLGPNEVSRRLADALSRLTVG